MLTQLFKLVFLHQMICEEAAKPESEIIWWSLRLLHISPHHLHFHHKVNPSAIKSYYEEPGGGTEHFI